MSTFSSATIRTRRNRCTIVAIAAAIAAALGSGCSDDDGLRDKYFGMDVGTTFTFPDAAPEVAPTRPADAGDAGDAGADVGAGDASADVGSSDAAADTGAPDATDDAGGDVTSD